jgi:hypothetical protein
VLQHRVSVDGEEEFDEAEAIERGRGVLFRVALRGGGLLFVAILALGLYEGLDPGVAFLRALGALLGLAVCGWLLERITRTPPRPSQPEKPVE